MAGELNGTNIILEKFSASTGLAEIVGQLEVTKTYSGAPIDISNKSYQDYVTLLNGELSSNGINLSGSIVYNNDLIFDELRQDREQGNISQYRLLYSVADPAAEDILLFGIPDTMSDAVPHGDKVTTSFSIQSTGQPSVQINLLSSDNFNLVSSDGLTLITGVPLGT